MLTANPEMMWTLLHKLIHILLSVLESFSHRLLEGRLELHIALPVSGACLRTAFAQPCWIITITSVSLKILLYSQLGYYNKDAASPEVTTS